MKKSILLLLIAGFAFGARAQVFVGIDLARVSPLHHQGIYTGFRIPQQQLQYAHGLSFSKQTAKVMYKATLRYDQKSWGDQEGFFSTTHSEGTYKGGELAFSMTNAYARMDKNFRLIYGLELYAQAGHVDYWYSGCFSMGAYEGMVSQIGAGPIVGFSARVLPTARLDFIYRMGFGAQIEAPVIYAGRMNSFMGSFGFSLIKQLPSRGI